MGHHDTLLKFCDQRSALVRGLHASTGVQTALGCRALSELGPGDLVMTKDAGLRPITGIHTEYRQALWSVRLPAGAVGNLETVMLPPGQPVLIKTRYALPFSGDDFALVPVTALEGWRGIAPHVPAMTEPILQILLGRPGILCLGSGLLVGCEGSDDSPFDIKRLLDGTVCPTLPLAAARQMIAHLVADEAGAAFRDIQAADFRPPNLS